MPWLMRAFVYARVRRLGDCLKIHFPVPLPLGTNVRIVVGVLLCVGRARQE